MKTQITNKDALGRSDSVASRITIDCRSSRDRVKYCAVMIIRAVSIVTPIRACCGYLSRMLRSFALAGLISAGVAQAQDATWLLNPPSPDWNTAASQTGTRPLTGCRPLCRRGLPHSVRRTQQPLRFQMTPRSAGSCSRPQPRLIPSTLQSLPQALS